VAEVAISFVLVVGAGLLVRTVVRLQAIDTGVRTDGVLTLDFGLPESRYPRDFSTYPHWPHVQFYERLTERLARLPGATSSALAAYPPLARGFTNSFVIVGREQEAASQPEIAIRAVSPGYLTTLGIPLLQGRDINATDRGDAPPVVLINEAAARRFFPDGHALGQRLRWWGATREIVGIIGNQRFYGLTAEAPPGAYIALAQGPMQSGTILLRSAAAPERMAPLVRAAVREVDPDLAVFNVGPLERSVLNSISRERSTMMLLAAFAAMALLLALIGVHGVLSYNVTQRQRELGVRLALGAARRDVLGMVAWQGVRLALLGTVIGLAAALAGARLLSGLLYGVTATDGLTFGAVTLLVLLVAAIASWLPARRAVAIDPMRALRSE
jgi:predicted permease